MAFHSIFNRAVESHDAPCYLMKQRDVFLVELHGLIMVLGDLETELVLD